MDKGIRRVSLNNHSMFQSGHGTIIKYYSYYLDTIHLSLLLCIIIFKYLPVLYETSIHHSFATAQDFCVKKMMNNVIDTTILNRKFKGGDVLLPRIMMIPTDIPFKFKLMQFPV